MSDQVAQRLRHPLMAVLLPIAAGIVLDRLCDVSLVNWWILAAVLGISLWAIRLLRQTPRALHLRIETVLLLGCLLATAAAWHHLRWNLFAGNELGFRAGEVAGPVCLRVQALEFPRHIQPEPDPLTSRPREDHSVFAACVAAARDGTTWRKVSGRLTIKVAGHLAGVTPGDRLRVLGQLRRGQPEMNPGGFSNYDYRRSRRELATLWVNYPAAVTTEKIAGRWSPRFWVARLRSAGHLLLWRYLPPHNAELAAALLLGERDYLDRNRTDAFFHTGTVHLLAISGLHVTILAMGLYFLARTGVLPTRFSLILIMGLTLLYAVVSGGRPPVVRATILVFVFCGGTLLRRDAPGFNALAAAAIIVLAINPCELFSTGAQLSFVAVGTMIWYVPLLTKPRPLSPVQRLIARHRSYGEVLLRIVGRKIWQVVVASILIWLVTLPLVSSRFHLVSPSALVLNAFLWVPVAVGLLSGFGVLLFGAACPPLAELCATICGSALGFLEICVQSADQLPGSYFWVAGSPLVCVALFYAVLFLGGVSCRWRRWWPVWTSAAYLIFLVGAVVNSPAKSWDSRALPLTCTFLSVGHGSCAVLEFPSGAIWLYDAGSLHSSHGSVTSVSRFLWQRGISRLDAIVLSHADVDHFNAVPGLVERFQVNTVYAWPGMFAHPNPSLDFLERALLDNDVPIRELAAGSVLRDKGVTVSVLHPMLHQGGTNDNANSLVLDLEYQRRNVLLTGDVEKSGLARLLSLPNRRCDLAMAPHHGSIGSHPTDFADWCEPTWVVVSGSLSDATGAGMAAFEAAGCRVLHTGVVGSVTATIAGGRINVATYREVGLLAQNSPQPE